MDMKLTKSQQHDLVARRSTASRASLREALPAGQEKWSFPSVYPSGDIPGSSSELPSAGQTWTYWSESAKGHWNIWFLSCEQKQGAGPVQAEEEKSQGDCVNVYTWLGKVKTEPDYSQWCPVTKGNGHKQKYRNFPLNLRRNIYWDLN